MESGASEPAWPRIEALFVLALDTDEDAREAVLAEACPDDPAVLDAVRRLLRAHHEAGGFLEELDTSRAHELLAREGDAEPERRIGPYRLVREIGRGGMGTVYLAERADGVYERRVALKRIRRGLDTDLVLQRFVHERQILAHLEHPNIARLIDGGSDDEGRPYLVMEHVEGVPLTDFVRSRALDVRARLRLVLEVCEAVRHAHRNLVVHRDLKPSNILVTDEGRVKLLDFGIARLMEDDRSPAVTQVGVRLLTPDYAAPEQLEGAAITTATDVYALGVVLYEVLTDQHPRTSTKTGGTGADPAASPAELPRPSRVARASGRRIDDELDWIVLMATRRDPARRYPTVDALAADLRAHLDGHVVRARPESPTYRLQKSFQRHRARYLASALALAIALGALVAHTTQIERERRRAEDAALEAQRISDLLLSLFEAADPWKETHGEPLTAQDIVRNGQERVRRELVDQPEIEASLLQVLGTIERRLGNFANAESLLTRSLALREALDPRRPDLVAHGRHALGQLLVDRGEYTRAEELFRDAIDVLEHGGRVTSREVRSMRNDLGALLYYEGRYPEAEAELRAVLAARAADPGDPDLAYTLNDLGLVLIDLGHYAEAESLLQRSLVLHRELRGDLHPDVASTANNLGLAYDYMGRTDEAETWYRRSLESYRSILGEQHPQVALIADNLGAMLSTIDHWQDSQEMLELALSIRRATLGPTSLAYGETLNNLGYLWKFQGDLERAEPALREARDIMAQHVEHTMPLAAATFALGDVIAQRGRPEEAEPLVREAMAMWTSMIGPDTPRLAGGHARLAAILHALDRDAEARASVEEGLRIAHLADAPDSALVARLDALRAELGAPHER